MKNLIFNLLAYSFLCFGCTDKEDKCRGYLQFDLPLQAYGIADTLHIGDSIRIRLDIPDKLAERTSGHVYDFVDYDFRLITYVEKIDTLPVLGAIEDFEWRTIEGASIKLSGVYAVLPKYANNKYIYEVVISPQKKGLYVFGMNCAEFRLSPLEKLNGPCRRNPVYVFMKLTNDSNTNFEFLKNSPEPVYVKTNRQRFDEFAGFCFYVR